MPPYTEILAGRDKETALDMASVTKTKVVPETKATPSQEAGVVSQSKSKKMPVSKGSAVTKYKGKSDSGNKISSGSIAKNTEPKSQKRGEMTSKLNSGHKADTLIVPGDEEENVCSWFWVGEEPSVGSWFWPKEENPFQAYNPIPKIEEKPVEPEPELAIKKKAAAWFRARYCVLVPLEGLKPPEGNWTLVETLIETPLGIRPLTKIPLFYDGPYLQTLAEVKEQIKLKERYGPSTCRCKSRTFSLEPEEFDKLVSLLRLTRDPFIHNIAKMIMGISPAYPFTQDIVHDVGINVMIENLINNPDTGDLSRTFNVVKSTSESLKERAVEKARVYKVCRDVFSRPMNSPAQLDALQQLVQLSVNYEEHHIVLSYLPDLLVLLNKGSVKTKFSVLKVFFRLSKNQVNTRELISAKVLSSLVAHFHKNESKANVLSIIEVFENINYHFKKKAKLFTKDQFTKSELISIFHEAKVFRLKLLDIAGHNDPEVRDKVMRLILKL